MEIWAIAGTSFLVGLSGALMPGPMLTVLIGESAKYGFWGGPLLVVGHGLVEGILVVALALGLGWVLGLSWVCAAIGVVGGAVLLWMAYGMLMGALRREVSLAGATESAGSVNLGPVLTGGVASASNPGWILWWSTVGLSYVVWASTAGGTGLVAFFGGHILADLGWFSLVAFLVSRGRHLLNDRLYRGIIVAFAIFLAGLSVYFIGNGLQSWFGR